MKFFFELLFESLRIATIAALACELLLDHGRMVWLYSMMFGTIMAVVAITIILVVERQRKCML
jgi:hypothetical protein